MTNSTTAASPAGTSDTARSCRGRPRSTRRLVAVLASVVAVLGVACVPEPPEPATGESPNDAPMAAVAAYAESGPYAAGVTTISLGDRDVEIWYPADPADTAGMEGDTYFVRDFVPGWVDDLLDPSVNPPYVTDAVRGVPASPDGPFPLVLFSHGVAGFRQTTTFLTTHLASWGFVVIAPDYLERGLRGVLGEGPASPRPDTVVADEAITAATDASNTAGNLLEGSVDAGAVFPIGHSAGGGTSLRLLQRPDVPSAIPMAAGISQLSLLQGTAPVLPADKAIMWIGGRNDGIAALEDVRNGFTYTPGQRKLVELSGAGHNNGFTELCEIGDGGISALARASGLPVPDALLNLGDDGCRVPPNVPSPEVWDEVRHFVTAELRFRAEIDAQPVGLGDAVAAEFGNVGSYRHNP